MSRKSESTERARGALALGIGDLDETTRLVLVLRRIEGLSVAEPGADSDWLERHRLTWALLRPDRFVFAGGGPDEVPTAIAAWRRIAPPEPREVAACAPAHLSRTTSKEHV